MAQTIPGTDVLERAVLLACRAPSVLNTQPWQWVYRGGVLHLFLSRGRILPVTDKSGREALISCGAVLDHLRVAMAVAGWESTTERFPSLTDPDHLASIRFNPAGVVTDTQRRRADAIPRRRTDRLPLTAPPNWDPFEKALRNTFDESIALFDVLSDAVRPQLAEASRLTESLRRDDASYLGELEWWTGPFALSDGVPPSALVSQGQSAQVDVARPFPVWTSEQRRTNVKHDAAKILLLSTHTDSRADALTCGEVLSAVLLDCTMAGMATCALTHLIELDESRKIVRKLIDNRGQPQVLIRVGIAPSMEDVPPATPRRPLADVLEIR